AEAEAASQPACPAPITITSKTSSKYIITNLNKKSRHKINAYFIGKRTLYPIPAFYYTKNY
ncbi:MAG TPA: hypothetical protein VK892_07940, partial [Pyrinomonadaceae bacterium]|nr:hypothetical protein [Pyrinomonadaceae bacterium]